MVHKTSHNEDPQPEVQKTTPEDSIEPVAETVSAIDYEAEMNKYKDNWLRAAAEIENIKRRARQDVDKAAFFSIEGFARDLVSVLDYLYSASDAITDELASTNEHLKTAKEGIEITKKELLGAFERNSIRRIYPKGEKFDHNNHQAVVQVEGDQAPDTVVDVLQAGYIIKDRLLRPAMVTVAKPKAH
jgi:molecular chaperone GrpE